jgi:hypothetical protein
MQHVTNTHVKRWKEHRHDIGYGHLYLGALQVFPRGNRGLILPSCPLRGAERPARKPRGASGIVALVEPTTCRARRPGVSDSLGMAFAASRRLGANGQPTANGSRTESVALFRQSRSTIRRSELGCRHSQAIESKMDASVTRKAEETSVSLSRLPVFARFGGRHLYSRAVNSWFTIRLEAAIGQAHFSP